jgi:gliding motility-associated-like protein
LAGHTFSNDGDVSQNNGGMDVWVVKLDYFGNLAWKNTYGGSADDDAYDIQQTGDGGYIVVGRTQSNDGDVSVNKGYDDVWIFKLDALGNIIWEKTYGGGLYDAAYAVQQLSGGGYIVTGGTDSSNGDIGNNAGNRDVWVLKLNNNGNLVWENTYGGSLVDGASNIQETPGGNYIVAGGSWSFDGDVPQNQGNFDVWVFELSPLGNILWSKTYGGSGRDGVEYGLHFGKGNDALVQMSGGGYIVAGRTYSTDGDVISNQGNPGYDNQVWLIKLNSNGNLIWEQTYGGTDEDGATAIQQTLDGNYIIAAQTGPLGSNAAADYLLFKIDSTGNMLWQQTYGGSAQDAVSSMFQVSGCEYIMAGHSNSNDGDVSQNNGQEDFWVVKVQMQWPPPTVATPQTFCWSSNATLADLGVTGNAVPTGFTPVFTWYDDDLKTNVLPDTTVLVDGETYFVSQTIDGCESPLAEVVVSLEDPTPTANTPQEFCEGNDLVLDDITVTGQNLSWYADAAGTLSIPNNTSLQDGETYYITQTINGCESSPLSIAVVVNPLPDAFPPPSFVLCDMDNDGIEQFHLPDLDNAITGGASGVTVSYHKTLPEAENDTPSLPDDYVNEESPSQTIFARVEDDVTGCFDTVEVVLEVVSVPEIADVEDLYGCDDGNNEAVFDLSQNNDNVLGSQNPNGLSISYHESQPDADSGDNAIPNPENYTSGPKPVFVRLESTGTDCYDTNSFELFVDPRPNIDDTPIALEVCSDEEGGNTAVVDLTQFDTQINSASPANTMVVYYANANEHTAGNSLQNPESYVAANNQIILAETFDTQTNCPSSTQAEITIRVNDRPFVDLGGNKTICWDSNLSTPVEGGNYEPIVLETGLDENEYAFEWNLNGEALSETSSSIEVTEPGEYEVVVSDTDGTTTTCSSTASITVNEANPPEFSLSRVSEAVGSSHSILVSKVSGIGNFAFRLDDGEWLPLGENGTLVFKDVPPGTHVVYGRSMEGCGTTVHSITLIGYPKFFTPNNDGQNDRWNIIGLKEGEVYIFDRYGKLLASLNPNGAGWDGNYNGHRMPSDDYWFKVEFVEKLPDGTEKAGEFAANFSLIR